MRGTELHGKHPKHKRRRRDSPPDMSEGEVSCESDGGVARNNDLKRSLSADSDSSVERVKKHKKKRKKHKRRHKHSEAEVESEPEVLSRHSPDLVAQQRTQRGQSRDVDLNSEAERRRRPDGDTRRRDRESDGAQEGYDFQRVKQDSAFEDNRARQYNMPPRPRHADGRHKQRLEGEHQSRRHHRRDEERPRHERADHTSSSHRGHARYHDDRRRSEEPGRGRVDRGGRQGGRSQWRDGDKPAFDPGQPIKQEKTSPCANTVEPQTFEWGKAADNVKVEKEAAPGDKEKPNFGLSGKLTEETNTFNGVVIKYSEPPEARKPRRRWRFYPFKGDKALQTLYIHRQSSYLMGRDRKIADIPIDHPSCSKQHAALQYRLVDFKRENGTAGKRVRPYIIDLESANGTFVNNTKIDAKKYVELLEKDVVKFGFSSREYVLLHEHSKDDDYEDVGELPEDTAGEAQDPAQ